MPKTEPLTVDDINVRIAVTCRFVVTAGLYGGPITREILAGLIAEQIDAAGGPAEYISESKIFSITHEATEEPLIYETAEEPTRAAP